jgi:ferredoxin-NADP reductase
MAVLTPRTVLTLAAGIGIGAAIAHRRAAAAAADTEPCCEQPASGASCC